MLNKNILLGLVVLTATTFSYGQRKNKKTSIDTSYMNRAISPKTNFFDYANGNWVKNIYPILPASSQITYKGMVMYTYTIKTKVVNISPQMFAMSDVYKVFKDGTSSDLAYFNDFNLDLYYGTSMDWKITRRFVLNTNIRYNTTWDKLSETAGYKKSNPIMFMIGTNFQF